MWICFVCCVMCFISFFLLANVYSSCFLLSRAGATRCSCFMDLGDVCLLSRLIRKIAQREFPIRIRLFLVSGCLIIFSNRIFRSLYVAFSLQGICGKHT